MFNIMIHYSAILWYWFAALLAVGADGAFWLHGGASTNVCAPCKKASSKHKLSKNKAYAMFFDMPVDQDAWMDCWSANQAWNSLTSTQKAERRPFESRRFTLIGDVG